MEAGQAHDQGSEHRVSGPFDKNLGDATGLQAIDQAGKRNGDQENGGNSVR
jgi:hypothetical protein